MAKNGHFGVGCAPCRGGSVSGKSVAVVLAAGMGTRMRSTLAKVLHPVLGRPMVCYPVEAALKAGVDRVAVVIGHQGEDVREVLSSTFPEADLVFAEQKQMLGTADAVHCALDATEGFERVLIMCGDTPALDAASLLRLIESHAQTNAALTLTSFDAPDPTGYGRIVRDLSGKAMRIVEHADASLEERNIKEVNAGLYLVQRDDLAFALGNIGNDNEVTIKYLAEKIIELTNSNSKIVYHELPINDPKQRKPDLTKAKELLNYKPKTSLEDGLKLTIDWISANYK